MRRPRRRSRQVSSSARRTGAMVLVLPRTQQALLLALPVLLFFGGALVVLFLAFRKTDVDFDAPAHVVKVERHQGVAGAIDPAYEPADLLRVEQELPRAPRIGPHVSVGAC